MRDEFQVSVVIPVYNAAGYVTQAVESALAQPEVAEVLLIEDGSPDNALVVCQGLAEKYDKVRLLRHPNGENRGAGASRNLGMRVSVSDFIGFLDADDFYLPGRFVVTKAVFESNPACDGVYEAIGMHIENEKGWERWRLSGKPQDRIKTIKVPVDPGDLGLALIQGDKGNFSLDGFVIKKNLLGKSGYMDEQLRIHQDTNFIIRAALSGRLLPGSIEKPVTMWRVHQANRVSSPKDRNERLRERMSFLLSTYSWAKKEKKRRAKNILVNQMFIQVTSLTEAEVNSVKRFTRISRRMSQLFAWANNQGEILLEPQFWKSLISFVFSGGSRP